MALPQGSDKISFKGCTKNEIVVYKVFTSFKV